MKFGATLASLAVVGHAQTATFTSKDFFGNTLTTMEVEYTAGERFIGEFDLSISPFNLKEIQLSSGTYGVDECTWLMHKESKKDKKHNQKKLVEVGKFKDMCDWPNFDKSSGVFTLNVENIPQLITGDKVYLECTSQEVTLSKATIDCEGKDNTAQNNQLDNPFDYFNFTPVVDSKMQFVHEAVGIYLTGLG